MVIHHSYKCNNLCTLTGCDRPSLNLLNQHVISNISSKWEDLGLALLERKYEEKLQQIKIENNKVSECCKEMFRLWLESCVTATWNQLIQALRVVGLTYLAATIEGMLRPKEDTVCASAGKNKK